MKNLYNLNTRSAKIVVDFDPTTQNGFEFKDETNTWSAYVDGYIPVVRAEDDHWVMSAGDVQIATFPNNDKVKLNQEIADSKQDRTGRMSMLLSSIFMAGGLWYRNPEIDAVINELLSSPREDVARAVVGPIFTIYGLSGYKFIVYHNLSAKFTLRILSEHGYIEIAP